MYEYNGTLLVYDATEVLTEATLTVLGDESYKVELTGKTYDSRPIGATCVTVNEIMRRYNLAEGESFPAQPVAQETDANADAGKQSSEVNFKSMPR